MGKINVVEDIGRRKKKYLAPNERRRICCSMENTWDEDARKMTGDDDNQLL